MHPMTRMVRSWRTLNVPLFGSKARRQELGFRWFCKADPTTVVAERERMEDIEASVPSFKAFIDFKFVQENLELVKDNCAKRNAQADPETVVQLYSEYLEAKQKREKLRADRNDNTKAMKVQNGILFLRASFRRN